MEKKGYVIMLKNITEFKELDSAKTTFISTISQYYPCLRQDRNGWGGDIEGGGGTYPAPDGGRGGAATGFDFRLGIQFFPWNHRVF